MLFTLISFIKSKTHLLNDLSQSLRNNWFTMKISTQLPLNSSQMHRWWTAADPRHSKLYQKNSKIAPSVPLPFWNPNWWQSKIAFTKFHQTFLNNYHKILKKAFKRVIGLNSTKDWDFGVIGTFENFRSFWKILVPLFMELKRLYPFQGCSILESCRRYNILSLFTMQYNITLSTTIWITAHKTLRGWFTPLITVV